VSLVVRLPLPGSETRRAYSDEEEIRIVLDAMHGGKRMWRR